MEQKIKIKIFDKDYIVKGEVDPLYIKKIANHLNERIDQVQTKFRNLSREQVIILAAMNITDDFMQLYDLIEEEKKR
ncbi:MAG: cell division protein ZapA [bacterium]